MLFPHGDTEDTENLTSLSKAFLQFDISTTCAVKPRIISTEMNISRSSEKDPETIEVQHIFTEMTEEDPIQHLEADLSNDDFDTPSRFFPSEEELLDQLVDTKSAPIPKRRSTRIRSKIAHALH
ncbi:unnamed protein product [Cuscuta epithymum]|uniref:Uncharacterized protein n=1 Tax=Cuscuta epithymum TaxID=186058 RepID=A0AAV0DXY1_9ASTE|nr:unnamed protein product [Cuscuta epithymum]CAH9146068.1 unnamed protein product [Cuscuta epithymum]